jgi:hypothetical protein
MWGAAIYVRTAIYVGTAASAVQPSAARRLCRVERAPPPAASDVSSAEFCLGELSCKQRSDDSSWASERGAPQPWRRKEQSDDFARVERAPPPAAFDVSSAEFCLGKLSCKEQSDEAGQFVGKRAGRAAVVAQEGAKRRPEPRRRRLPPPPASSQNKSGRPQAARRFELEASS